MKKKILVGISGGVNSAVTAALLKSQGFNVQGAHLQYFDPRSAPASRFGSRCCFTKDPAAAKEVCRKLDIPFRAVPVQDLFEDKVVDFFVHELLQSREPNPCIPCNLEVRFETLFRLADEMGCELLATGHHAQTLRDAQGTGGNTQARLQRAVNAQKDQSYFLFGLTQKQLARLVFPLGGFQDVMIERLAREFELPASSAGNPQEICLSRGEAHLPFFEARVPASLRLPGNIRMTDGAVMGEHHGLYAFRIGQQKIKLAAHIKDSEKYLVTGFDVPGRALVIGSEKDLYHAEVRASRATWIRPMDSLRGLKTLARFSPSQAEALPCRVTHFENRMLRVEFDEPCKGLLVGSAIVFYDGDEVLGGATLDSIGSLPKGE